MAFSNPFGKLLRRGGNQAGRKASEGNDFDPNAGGLVGEDEAHAHALALVRAGQGASAAPYPEEHEIHAGAPQEGITDKAGEALGYLGADFRKSSGRWGLTDLAVNLLPMRISTQAVAQFVIGEFRNGAEQMEALQQLIDQSPRLKHYIMQALELMPEEVTAAHALAVMKDNPAFQQELEEEKGKARAQNAGSTVGGAIGMMIFPHAWLLGMVAGGAGAFAGGEFVQHLVNARPSEWVDNFMRMQKYEQTFGGLDNGTRTLALCTMRLGGETRDRVEAALHEAWHARFVTHAENMGHAEEAASPEGIFGRLMESHVNEVLANKDRERQLAQALAPRPEGAKGGISPEQRQQLQQELAGLRANMFNTEVSRFLSEHTALIDASLRAETGCMEMASGLSFMDFTAMHKVSVAEMAAGNLPEILTAREEARIAAEKLRAQGMGQRGVEAEGAPVQNVGPATRELRNQTPA